MLNIRSFTFNPFQENTYVIYNDNKQCWIVDPGMENINELQLFSDFIIQQELKPQAIINTHTHLDHIFGVNALKDKYNIPFGIHKADQPVLDGAAGSAMLFGFEFGPSPEVDFYIEAGKNYSVGDEELEVRLVPGHSPGSIVFYYPAGKWVIGGDALFHGSIGRTDLPGGNHQQLLDSIKAQLFTLPDDTVVHSGHGPETNIGFEKANNPFLQ